MGGNDNQEVTCDGDIEGYLTFPLLLSVYPSV